MTEEDRNERDKDFHRINSVNIGTPGHWWGSYEQKKSKETPEIDPGKLNLNKAEDFLLFLNAVSNGHIKALNFLKKIPQERKEELKKIHSQFEGFFSLLG